MEGSLKVCWGGEGNTLEPKNPESFQLPFSSRSGRGLEYLRRLPDQNLSSFTLWASAVMELGPSNFSSALCNSKIWCPQPLLLHSTVLFRCALYLWLQNTSPSPTSQRNKKVWDPAPATHPSKLPTANRRFLQVYWEEFSSISLN